MIWRTFSWDDFRVRLLAAYDTVMGMQRPQLASSKSKAGFK
jgi:hypothetical protein